MKKFFTLFIALCFTSMSLVAHESDSAKSNVKESIVYTAAFYFDLNHGDIIENYESAKADKLLKWAESNSSALIDIKGWADPSGTEVFNTRLSGKRANAVRNYLVNNGIASSRISVEGKGIDYTSADSKARRADVVAYVRVVEPEIVEDARAEEPIEDIDTKMQVEPEVPVEPAVQVEPEVVEDAKAAEPVEAVDAAMQVEPEVEVVEAVAPVAAVAAAPLFASSNRFYIGAGAGVSFGESTFTSFADDGTKVGLNANLLVGMEFNSLISAELNFGYSAMNLGSCGCGETPYYVVGEEYLVPFVGEKNFPYRELSAKTDMYSVSARAVVNIVSLFCDDSRWQGLIIPSAGFGYSKAKLKYENCFIATEKNTHLILGGALGAGYSLTDNWGLRLTSGVYHISGGEFDAMPQCECSGGNVWDTTLGVIYKF